MQSMWETHLEEICDIIYCNQDHKKVEKLVSKLLKKEVTFNAVESALRRLRSKGWKIPLISELREGRKFVPPASTEDLIVKIPASKTAFDTLPSIVSLKHTPRKIAVIPDIHFPIHDPYAIASMIAYLRDYKPDFIVMLGDLLDCSCLSRHPTSHVAEKLFDIKYKLKEEIRIARPFLKEVISISKGNLCWIEGNHEIRRKNILNSNPGLQGLEVLEAKNLFEIPDEVIWVENSQRFQIGNLFFEHGDKVLNSRGSAQVANSMALRRPHCNTFTGHWHCVDRKTRIAYWPDGSHEAFLTATVGHLSKVDEHSHYAKLPNWSHGFATIETWVENGKMRFTFDQVEMSDYAFSKNGKVYSGKKLM